MEKDLPQISGHILLEAEPRTGNNVALHHGYGSTLRSTPLIEYFEEYTTSRKTSQKALERM